MNQIFLGLGTNMGNRKHNLKQAIYYLNRLLGSVIKESSIYETTSWGVTDQPDYLNMVIILQTNQSPQNTLATILAIEQLIGRVRTTKWGSRLIDIDLLFYNDLVLKSPNLVIPHPYIHERNFVLVPLNEIASELVHPTLGVDIDSLLQKCEDQLACKKKSLPYTF